MSRQSQKGSALLIVLGFLSFMVVSAVAFAVWMRNERLPSSALRRSVASRFLVKAALAQAMSRVDDAIRSHVYPGAWNTNQQDFAYRDPNGCAYDWWESRVFMPPDPEGLGTTVGDPNSRYAPVTKTVSVLSLEALGYLPPSIANDVRLLSRSSWAAQWEYFNFDAGRYAFCAVNVSDMLDVNKIAADSPRTSGSAARAASAGEKPPPSRFSLAYLFRGSKSETSASAFEPQGNACGNFDDLIHKERGGLSQFPLVSLMDYNLCMENKTFGSGYRIYSPFYFYVSGQTRSDGFYGGDSDATTKGPERQPFVTDSWFPRSESESALVDLGEHQPFKMSDMAREKSKVRDAILDNDFNRVVRDDGRFFSRIDEFVLYDYLDKDDVPLSLAMPCVERVPMITALGPDGALTVTFDPLPTAPTETRPDGETLWKYYDIKMKVTPPTRFSSGIVFPFKGDSGNDGNYSVQAFMRLAFIDEGSNTSEDPTLKRVREAGYEAFRPSKREQWDRASAADDKQFLLPDGSSDEASCLLLTLFGSTTCNLKSDRERYDDTFVRGDMMMGNREVTATIMRKVEKWKMTKREDGTTQEEGPPETYYEIKLRPFDVGGTVRNDDQYGRMMTEAEFDQFANDHNLRPYLLTWVRVKKGGESGADDTVDMVPATYDDDLALNDVDNDRSRAHLSEACGTEKGLPILYFPGKKTFTYANAKTGSFSQDMEWKYKSCFTLDPRFNWAPENWWFDETVDKPDSSKWYNKVFGSDERDSSSLLNQLVAVEFNGSVPDRGDRARDPFLFVSNLGYLQSVGEMAFLPRLSRLNNTTVADPTLVEGRYDGNMRIGDTIDTIKTLPCADAAWKCYQSYRTNPNGFELGANLYRRGLINAPQGFYVNPFTPSREIMLAAFANTPANYWVAGTNTLVKSPLQKKFGDYATDEMIDGKFTEFRAGRLADYMIRRFEDLSRMIRITGNPNASQSYQIQKIWEDMFDALDWSGCMEEGRPVSEIYEDLRMYFEGGAALDSYENMYKTDNGYDGLNAFMPGAGRPGITLDTSRAVHGNDPADPLYYAFENSRAREKELCDVDRIFLHSYWRDCFANKQQLFLIFVRAEATALGGAGEGTPAQQGGRAVALVWRDPAAPKETHIVENDIDNQSEPHRHPHKMRVLFYRQLD